MPGLVLRGFLVCVTLLGSRIRWQAHPETLPLVVPV
jgi:hypothetical protein